jgi:RHS repeat-associated protein
MAPQDQPVMLTVKTDLNLATPNTALNNQPAERQGTLFARRVAFTSTAEWAKIDINATGGDPSRTARTLGNRWVPPQTEAMTYDADGNLTGDARWIYRWDGEGRLSELETQSTAGAVGLPMVKLVFGYDAGSRRVMKRVYANLGGTTTAPIWVLQNDVRFVYVGWHMIGEPSRGTEARQPDDCVGCPAGVRMRAEHPKQLEIKGNATDAPAGGGANPPPFLRRSWLWGEDLTGTAPAAVGDQSKLGAGGGVGGLLAVTRHARGDQPAESYWATSDLNGNVIGLLATSSTKTAVYDYDPFGQPIRVNEPEAGLNPVRFSSKYTDAETGLCYYGYRYYSPEVGRWLGRDPIGENGGINLYGMLGNDAANRIDVLGLAGCRCGPDVTSWLIDEINTNANSATAKRMRALLRHSATAPIAYGLWAAMVRPGGPWDHKPKLNKAKSANCPASEGCKFTVTLCGKCLSSDVPSNIHYGFVGRAIGFGNLALTLAPGVVQESPHWPLDDPADTEAINAGYSLGGVQLSGMSRKPSLGDLFSNALATVLPVFPFRPDYTRKIRITRDQLCSEVGNRSGLQKPTKEKVLGECVPCGENWP